MPEILTLTIVFIVALFASSYGTLTGGTSLLTIPTLIFLGLSPVTAIGTNRTGLIGLPIAGWYKFHKKKEINYKIGWSIGISAMLGAIIGANLVLSVNQEILKKIVAGFTIIILFLLISKPEIGIMKMEKAIKKRYYLIGIVLSFFIGMYGGFYGAGAGTFFAYLLILLFGQTFIGSAATRKIASLLIAIMAAVVFAINDVIIYPIAIALFIGSFIGSYIGVHYSDVVGNVWIKRLFVVIVLTMSIRLLI